MKLPSSEITIDIVIPFGGNFGFLMQTISSVLNQVYPNWQMYVLDDNTNCVQLKSYIESLNDSRVTLIQYNSKLGIIGIFNESISTFRNRWGLILCADDLLEKNYLYEMCQAIRAFPDSILIQPSVKVINVEGKVIYPIVDISKTILRGIRREGEISIRRLQTSLAMGNWLYFAASVFDTNFLKKHRFNPEFEIAMDYELIIRMVEAEAQFVSWPDAIFFYRRHDSSYSNSLEHLDRRFREEMQILKGFANRLQSNNKIFLSILAHAGISVRTYKFIFKLKKWFIKRI